ncbi:MAG: Tim44 domain-containing protein [Proteobacteria bacterium]|nr:Tim44 domain-containing protein [Pseudomonadota bacterium]
MKRILFGFMAALLGVGLATGEADAAKLGGSRSMGTQRNITSAPAATPPRNVQQAAPATPPAAAPQPQSALSRWAPMLGGLAIGGLLGSMFAGGGFGGAMGSILMMALLAFAAVFVVRLFMRGRGAPQPAPAGGPMQYSGLGNETVAAPPPSQAAGFEAQPVRTPANVPAGFDSEGFTRQAKLSYIRMQTANDAGNLAELREFTTPEMFEALKGDIDARGGAKQFTDVVTLNADLLEVVTEGNTHWASVRFSGLVREVPGQAPGSFEEIWNLAKPADGSTGWLLAGIQQMH